MRFPVRLLALLPALAAADAPLLLIWPLDTTVVTFDSSASTASLIRETDAKKHPPSPAALITRELSLGFGLPKTTTHGHRVQIVDSSRANPAVLSPFETVRASCAGCGDSASFRVPLAVDADSSRYVLVIGALSFSSKSRTVGRRFVPPSPPGIDPVTGEMTPGLHKGYPEGPGLMTTLTATAAWVIWDRGKNAAHAVGRDSGASTFRGEARPAHWHEASRNLAAAIRGKAGFARMR
jgi:hypothetical protein